MPKVDYTPLAVGDVRTITALNAFYSALTTGGTGLTAANYAEEGFDASRFGTNYPVLVEDEAGDDTRTVLANSASYVLMTIGAVDIKSVGGHSLAAGDILEIEARVCTKTTVGGTLGLGPGLLSLILAGNRSSVVTNIASSERRISRSGTTADAPDVDIIVRGFIEGADSLTDVRLLYKLPAPGVCAVGCASIVATKHHRTA